MLYHPPLVCRTFGTLFHLSFINGGCTPACGLSGFQPLLLRHDTISSVKSPIITLVRRIVFAAGKRAESAISISSRQRLGFLGPRGKRLKGQQHTSIEYFIELTLLYCIIVFSLLDRIEFSLGCTQDSAALKYSRNGIERKGLMSDIPTGDKCLLKGGDFSLRDRNWREKKDR